MSMAVEDMQLLLNEVDELTLALKIVQAERDRAETRAANLAADLVVAKDEIDRLRALLERR